MPKDKNRYTIDAILDSIESGKAPTPSKFDLTALVQQIGQEEGVDPRLLLAMIKQESGGSSSAQSWAGASGTMQLMPGTAARYGVKNVRDPEQNIRGGAKYMRDLLNMFGGDVQQALAAYNAGEGRVLKRGYEWTRGLSNLKGGKYGQYSGSTGEYVDKITANYQKGGGSAGSQSTGDPEIESILDEFDKQLTPKPATTTTSEPSLQDIDSVLNEFDKQLTPTYYRPSHSTQQGFAPKVGAGDLRWNYGITSEEFAEYPLEIQQRLAVDLATKNKQGEFSKRFNLVFGGQRKELTDYEKYTNITNATKDILIPYDLKRHLGLTVDQFTALPQDEQTLLANFLMGIKAGTIAHGRNINENWANFQKNKALQAEAIRRQGEFIFTKFLRGIYGGLVRNTGVAVGSVGDLLQGTPRTVGGSDPLVKGLQTIGAKSTHGIDQEAQIRAMELEGKDRFGRIGQYLQYGGGEALGSLPRVVALSALTRSPILGLGLEGYLTTPTNPADPYAKIKSAVTGGLLGASFQGIGLGSRAVASKVPFLQRSVPSLAFRTSAQAGLGFGQSVATQKIFSGKVDFEQAVSESMLQAAMEQIPFVNMKTDLRFIPTDAPVLFKGKPYRMVTDGIKSARIVDEVGNILKVPRKQLAALKIPEVVDLDLLIDINDLINPPVKAPETVWAETYGGGEVTAKGKVPTKGFAEIVGSVSGERFPDAQLKGSTTEGVGIKQVRQPPQAQDFLANVDKLTPLTPLAADGTFKVALAWTDGNVYTKTVGKDVAEKMLAARRSNEGKQRRINMLNKALGLVEESDKPQKIKAPKKVKEKSEVVAEVGPETPLVKPPAPKKSIPAEDIPVGLTFKTKMGNNIGHIEAVTDTQVTFKYNTSQKSLTLDKAKVLDHFAAGRWIKEDMPIEVESEAIPETVLETSPNEIKTKDGVKTIGELVVALEEKRKGGEKTVFEQGTPYKKGDTVTIYQDPLTQKKKENQATLVKKISEDGLSGTERWTVKFPGDRASYERIIRSPLGSEKTVKVMGSPKTGAAWLVKEFGIDPKDAVKVVEAAKGAAKIPDTPAPKAPKAPKVKKTKGAVGMRTKSPAVEQKKYWTNIGWKTSDELVTIIEKKRKNSKLKNEKDADWLVEELGLFDIADAEEIVKIVDSGKVEAPVGERIPFPDTAGKEPSKFTFVQYIEDERVKLGVDYGKQTADGTWIPIPANERPIIRNRLMQYAQGKFPADSPFGDKFGLVYPDGTPLEASQLLKEYHDILNEGISSIIIENLQKSMAKLDAPKSDTNVFKSESNWTIDTTISEGLPPTAKGESTSKPLFVMKYDDKTQAAKFAVESELVNEIREVSGLELAGFSVNANQYGHSVGALLSTPKALDALSPKAIKLTNAIKEAIDAGAKSIEFIELSRDSDGVLDWALTRERMVHEKWHTLQRSVGNIVGWSEGPYPTVSYLVSTKKATELADFYGYRLFIQELRQNGHETTYPLDNPRFMIHEYSAYLISRSKLMSIDMLKYLPEMNAETVDWLSRYFNAIIEDAQQTGKATGHVVSAQEVLSAFDAFDGRIRESKNKALDYHAQKLGEEFNNDTGKARSALENYGRGESTGIAQIARDIFDRGQGGLDIGAIEAAINTGKRTTRRTVEDIFDAQDRPTSIGDFVTRFFGSLESEIESQKRGKISIADLKKRVRSLGIDDNKMFDNPLKPGTIRATEWVWAAAGVYEQAIRLAQESIKQAAAETDPTIKASKTRTAQIMAQKVKNIYLTMTGVKTELGRGLNILKYLDQANRPSLEAGDSMLDYIKWHVAQKDNQPPLTEADIEYLSGLGPDQLQEAAIWMSKRAQHGFGDKIYAYLTANLLSGITTQALNASTNLGSTWLGPLMKIPQAGLEALVRHKGDRKVILSEIPVQYKAMWDDMRLWSQGEAWRTLATVLKTGYSESDLLQLEVGSHYRFNTDRPGGYKHPMNLLGAGLNVPGDFLNAADVLFLTQNRIGESMATAHRLATQRGLVKNSPEYLEFIDTQFRTGFEGNEKIIDDISNTALEAVFRSYADPFSMYSIVEKAANLELPQHWGVLAGTKPFRILAMPFVRTIQNLMRMGLDFTPLGIVKPVAYKAGLRILEGNLIQPKKDPTKPSTKGEEARQRRIEYGESGEATRELARGIVGTLLMATLYGAAKQGFIEIYNDAPRDPDKMQEFLEEGKQAYSLRIMSPGQNDVVVSYKTLGPLLIPVSMVAELLDTEKAYEEEGREMSTAEVEGWANRLSAFIWAEYETTRRSATEVGPFGGLSNIHSFISTEEREAVIGGTNVLANFGNAMVPFTGFRRNVAQALDPAVYRRPEVEEAESISQKAAILALGRVKSTIPGLRQTVPERGGEGAIQRPGHIWGLLPVHFAPSRSEERRKIDEMLRRKPLPKFGG